MAFSISAGVSRKSFGYQLSNFFDSSRIAASFSLLDLRENAFDRLAHLGVGGLDRARVHSALEAAGHDVLSVLLHVMAGRDPAIHVLLSRAV